MNFLKKNWKIIISILIFFIFLIFVFYFIDNFLRNAKLNKNLNEISKIKSNIALNENKIKDLENEGLKRKISMKDDHIKNLKSDIEVLKNKLEECQSFTEENAYKKLLLSKYYNDWIVEINKNRPKNKPVVYNLGMTSFCDWEYEFEFREDTGVVNAFHENYCVNAKTLEIESREEKLLENKNENNL